MKAIEFQKNQVRKFIESYKKAGFKEQAQLIEKVNEELFGINHLLQMQAEYGWIKCKPGQMPEDFEDYDPEKQILVINESKARVEARVRCYSSIHTEKHYWSEGDCITYWQPMPQFIHYEEDDEE